jgi:hypothetical protein
LHFPIFLLLLLFCLNQSEVLEMTGARCGVSFPLPKGKFSINVLHIPSNHILTTGSELWVKCKRTLQNHSKLPPTSESDIRDLPKIKKTYGPALAHVINQSSSATIGELRHFVRSNPNDCLERLMAVRKERGPMKPPLLAEVLMATFEICDPVHGHDEIMEFLSRNPKYAYALDSATSSSPKHPLEPSTHTMPVATSKPSPNRRGPKATEKQVEVEKMEPHTKLTPTVKPTTRIQPKFKHSGATDQYTAAAVAMASPIKGNSAMANSNNSGRPNKRQRSSL